MYSLLIADDEASIREGLKYILEWDELGFEVIGDAGNGEEALSIILDKKPDVVMLDVRMPKMHGTDVIREARKAGYKGKCIILSGYSDFKYAQDAISSGVSFYLTKPLDEEELLEAIAKIRKDLENKEKENSFFEELEDICMEGADKTKEVKLDEEMLFDYTEKLSGFIQTFNRNMLAETLATLESDLYQSGVLAKSIKLFLTDLYLSIRDNIIRSHNAQDLPFKQNSAVIEFIGSRDKLSDIILFMSSEFEAIMNASGSPTRDSILDDVIYYIQHNYMHNIKLETIAPLFGYNTAYLGKIFNRTVGENFNSYIDHCRIDKSKELLEEKKWKVYEIAEQVGYSSVDYFHKKFKKYTGMSPAEYKKSV